tara:strand:- start:8737 stop:9225 length:489 start_codon:yes stop_codon:yes gene_type:complete
MSKFKIEEGRYFSTNDFVGSNDLEKLADQLFGKGWEAGDDVDQMQELCDSVSKNKYRVKYIEGLRSDCDLEVEEVEPQYIDNSTWIRVISDLATDVVEARYGEHTYETVAGESRFTEEAQDDYNDLYDRYESVFRVSFNIASEIDDPATKYFSERKEVSNEC